MRVTTHTILFVLHICQTAKTSTVQSAEWPPRRSDGSVCSHIEGEDEDEDEDVQLMLMVLLMMAC